MVLRSVELCEQTFAKMKATILLNEALEKLERNKEKVQLDSFIKVVINNGEKI